MNRKRENKFNSIEHEYRKLNPEKKNAILSFLKDSHIYGLTKKGKEDGTDSGINRKDV